MRQNSYIGKQPATKTLKWRKKEGFASLFARQFFRTEKKALSNLSLSSAFAFSTKF
uniref:Uncharacterized protein n=1 Tax=Anguilla anguilla TaxID=7936 RepID=A0A0E9WB65_ANGAN